MTERPLQFLAGHADEPSLRLRWAEGMRQLRLCDGAESLLDDLLTRYREPHRRYHTLQHIADCQQMLNQVRLEMQNLPAVEMALWFHDAIYDTTRKDNEALSAELAARQLSKVGCEQETIETIVCLINATNHRSQPTSPDAALLCDIDLAVLGQAPSEYDRYAAAIREEYCLGGLAPADFDAGRAAFLRGMLVRSTIFHTVKYRDRLDADARANMARELARLDLAAEGKQG